PGGAGRDLDAELLPGRGGQREGVRVRPPEDAVAEHGARGRGGAARRPRSAREQRQHDQQPGGATRHRAERSMPARAASMKISCSAGATALRPAKEASMGASGLDTARAFHELVDLVAGMDRRFLEVLDQESDVLDGYVWITSLLRAALDAYLWADPL